MMKTLIPLALILAPAAVPLLAPSPAQAQQVANIVRISFADLDLSREEGRAVLDRRLARAVEKVCPSERAGYITGSPEALRCKKRTRQQIAEARQQALAQRGGTIRISAVP